MDKVSGRMRNIKIPENSWKACSGILYVPGRLILPAAYLHKTDVPVSGREGKILTKDLFLGGKYSVDISAKMFWKILYLAVGVVFIKGTNKRHNVIIGAALL